MNIIPDLVVHFCRDTEISKLDQRDFNSLEEQQQYFMLRLVATVDRCYFIRTEGSEWSGSIKVGIPYLTLYNCDYLFYRNTGFLNKYFYAYITNIQYIDTNTTKVSFTIDHYQTWLLDYEIKFAETLRQTVLSSEALIRNKYIYPDVDVGGVYKLVSTQTIDLTDDMCILLFGLSVNFVAESAMQIAFLASQGQFYPGAIFVYRMSDPERYAKLKEDLYKYLLTLKFDKCVLMPNIGGMLDSLNCWPLGTEVIKQIELSGEVLKQLTTPVYGQYSFDLHIPQEYKLDLKILQDPYIKYSLLTSGGNSLDNINIGMLNSNLALSISVTAIPLLWPDPMVVLYLNNYNGVLEVQDTLLPDYLKFNRLTRLIIRDFPNILTNEVDLLSIALSLIGVAGGLATGSAGFLQATLGALSPAALHYSSLDDLDFSDVDSALDRDIDSMNRQQALKSSKLNTFNNSIKNFSIERTGKNIIDSLGQIACLPMRLNSTSLAYIWQLTFKFTISLTQYILSNIDTAYEVFKRYGYQYIGFDVDTKLRPHWNYIRTLQCQIAGPIPEDAKHYIESMYNNGVTFWHDDDLYNYDRDNM